MLAITTTAWWAIGFAIGAVVVLVAASLLVAIILLAKRVVRQAGAIAAALDGAREHTNPLFDIADVNFALERITRGLKAARGEQGAEDERGLLGRIASKLTPGGETG